MRVIEKCSQEIQNKDIIEILSNLDQVPSEVKERLILMAEDLTITEYFGIIYLQMEGENQRVQLPRQ